MAHGPRTIEYYFSFISLWSYIGSRALRGLAQRRQLEIVFKPVDLMAVFAATGGLPVKQRSAARQAYRRVEMQRFQALRGIPLVLEPKFYPANPWRGHRMLLAAVRAGDDAADFVDAALRTVWADEGDIEDPATLMRLADRSGLAGRALFDASAAPDLAAAETALTGEAIQRNVFGAPFFYWCGEPFWGQDRLELLEAAIASNRPPITDGR